MAVEQHTRPAQLPIDSTTPAADSDEVHSAIFLAGGSTNSLSLVSFLPG
jgi:hypothetical protein